MQVIDLFKAGSSTLSSQPGFAACVALRFDIYSDKVGIQKCRSRQHPIHGT